MGGNVEFPAAVEVVTQKNTKVNPGYATPQGPRLKSNIEVVLKELK